MEGRRGGGEAGKCCGDEKLHRKGRKRGPEEESGETQRVKSERQNVKEVETLTERKTKSHVHSLSFFLFSFLFLTRIWR